MWATTAKPSNPPDLLMYERRLTNHPSIARKKVAFVGQICGRLRRIAQPLLNPIQLWEHPEVAVEFNQDISPIVGDAPVSLLEPAIKAIAFSRGQAMFLPQLPTPTLEHLSDLSITRAGGAYFVDYSDEVLHSIGSCRRLRNLDISDLENPSVSSTTKLVAGLASIPTLQTLALDDVYIASGQRLLAPLVIAHIWQAPLVRLEVVFVTAVTFTVFVGLMGKVAATLQVATFFHSDRNVYLTSGSAIAVVASFPQLWKLDIGFGVAAHPRYRPRHTAKCSTPAGCEQVAKCSPIAVWKAAPRLEYFNCTERIELKTQEELDEVGELLKRDATRTVRLKLETWEGDKGYRWAREVKQDVTVG